MPIPGSIFRTLVSILACFLPSQCLSLAVAQPIDHLQQLVLKLDKPSPQVDGTRTALASYLSGIKPARKSSPESKVTEKGHYMLFGDLFRTGDFFALLEVPSTSTEGDPENDTDIVAFAEWTDGKWVLCGMWNITPVWRPAGWKKTNEPLPVTPATRPFELRDLSRDGIPELIIAGEVDNYFQEHYVLRFDGKSRSIALVATSMEMPVAPGKYVVLFRNSGRRAIWGECEYLEWRGNKLATKAIWHDETPYNSDEPPFVEATVTGRDGTSIYKSRTARVQPRTKDSSSSPNMQSRLQRCASFGVRCVRGKWNSIGRTQNSRGCSSESRVFHAATIQSKTGQKNRSTWSRMPPCG